MSNLSLKPLPADLSFKGLFAANQTYHYFENAKAHPFRFASNKFQLVNAWWLAEASMLVYVQDENFIRACLEKAGLKGFRFFDKGETQCFVVHNDNYIIVSFRGTETKKEDFFTDIKFKLADSEQGGKVHSGFKIALNQVWNDLEKYLRTIRSKSSSKQNVWFTGHSLGAALAILAADRYGDVQGVYTYGSPRVGDNQFALDYFANTYRIVNNNDLVTMIPPPILGYRHVGALKYIDRKGHIHDNQNKWTQRKDRFQGHFSHLTNALGHWKSGAFDAIPNDNLNDHGPIYYVVKIWNNYVQDLS